MTVPFRIIDSGVREGRLQISYDQALVELHGEGQVPDTVRFLRFTPTVLIGRHQVLSHELNLDDCQANGIGIVRRITGGGAIYLDEGQVGWELVFSRTSLPMPDLGAYTRSICEAVAGGLSAAFDIQAQFRPRNDIEVDGKKLCGTGGFFEGNTLMYQGTVLVDVDPKVMMKYLNVPVAKLEKHDLEKAEQRVTTLRELLGRAPSVNEVHEAILVGLCDHLGIVGENSEITALEEQRTRQAYDDQIGSDEFVHEIDNPESADVTAASHTGAGGTVTAYVRTEGSAATRRVREVLLTGDYFVTPPRAILDLEASLRGVMIDDVSMAVDRYFATANIGMMTLSPAEIRAVITAALNHSNTT